MVSEKQVMDALRKCIDPEIGVDIVDLGLVYGVQVRGDGVKVKMTLTTPGCPMHAFFVKDVEEKVKAVPGVRKAEVEMVWDPPWTPARISEEARKRLGITG
ncbi:MAG: metal-sulfur cluster assembly factor [Candidatus Micrarchaeota archaeon]|nr:metal-sulfur cluster assembly factor [Candidatus Micrarchaeota archaeon]